VLALPLPPRFSIVFSSGRNPLGALIRRATDSRYSHVVIRRRDDDSDLVFEAWGGHRCSVRPYSVYLDRKADVLAEYELLGDPARLQAAWDWGLHEYCDDAYGWLQLPGDYWAIVADKVQPNKRHRNPFASKALVCSELVGRILRRAEMPGLSRVDMERVSPEDLAEIATWHPREYGRMR